MRSLLRLIPAAAILSLLPACGEPPADRELVHVPIAVPPLDNCNLPADSLRLLVVLDHSGSMRPFWADVRSALPEILAALPDGSWLSLQLFSDRAVTQIPDVQLSPGTRPLLMQQLASLAEPRRLAPTDIGMALRDAAMDIASAASSRRGVLTFLFVISDGEHAPVPGSPYPTSGSFSPLIDRWAALEGDSRIRISSHIIPIGSGGLAGAAEFERVIPRSRVLIPLQPVQIGSAVRGEIATAMADLVLAQSAPEVKEPRLNARLTSPGQPVAYTGDTHTTVTVSSSAACVTYDVAGTVGRDSTRFTLAPGDSARIPVRLRSSLGVAAALPWTEREGSSPTDLSLTGVIASKPGEDLLEAGVDTTARAATLPVGGSVVQQPMSWMTFLTPVGGATLLLILVGLRFGRPARLWGTVQTNGGPATDLGELDAGSYDLVLPNGARIRFRARKRNPFGFDGFDTDVSVEPMPGIALEVRTEDETMHVGPGRRVPLHPDCTIRVVSAGDSEPTTLTWN
jgi:hypothetical protein